MIQVKEADVNGPEAVRLIGELNEVLAKITGNSGAGSFVAEDTKQDRSTFVIAYDDGKEMGCGALRMLTENIGEIKRVYARTNHCGIGHTILRELESKARTYGYSSLVLETRRVNEKAKSFYIRHGYVPCANYGKYIGRKEAICFTKAL